MDLKIEYLDKTDLKPYANNTKIHTPDQIKQIKKSIREFGFNDPIAVWHENEIVEGHGRLMAAMEMDELQLIPVIRLDDLTDQQRKAYAIVHNTIVLQTGFNIQILQEELDKIQAIDMSDFDFTLKKDLQEDQDFQQMFTDEPIEKKHTKNTIICPCCGKEISKEDLQYID